MRTVQFTVLGTPKPQGSKRHVGNGVMVEQGGAALRTWREDVKHAAAEARDKYGQALQGGVVATIRYRVARPRSHYRTGKYAHLLRDRAPWWPVTKPDLDKLIRSTFDAITTAALWRDDAQVIAVHADLAYATPERPPGADIELRAYDPTTGEPA